jgi:hypothetical protein
LYFSVLLPPPGNFAFKVILSPFFLYKLLFVEKYLLLLEEWTNQQRIVQQLMRLRELSGKSRGTLAEGQFNGQCPLIEELIAYIVPVLDRFYAEKVHLGLNMRYRFTHEDELIEAALNEASSELNRFGLNLLNECLLRMHERKHRMSVTDDGVEEIYMNDSKEYVTF